ncbi:MAG: topoisomerase C-terminal repeat-containing protein, partial [Croceimicrobium sp.]
RYGSYLKSGRKNFKLPKEIEDPAALTREEAEKIIEESAKKPAKSRARKSTKTKSKK